MVTKGEERGKDGGVVGGTCSFLSIPQSNLGASVYLRILMFIKDGCCWIKVEYSAIQMHLHLTLGNLFNLLALVFPSGM